MVDGLRPADLDRDGLAAVLQAQLTLAGRAHGVAVELDVDDPPDLDPEAEHEVLRIAQEAVTNALRHASPGTVRSASPRCPSTPIPVGSRRCSRWPTMGPGSTPMPGRSGRAGSGSRRCTSGPPPSADA